ncbi:magnesium chelatase subunit D [Citreimonas sp.]|uniref:magnesium chelatase subunit D n=1 Tax=Citreimonas sp. TaxID=3036715 RepID=UPI004059E456
MIEDPVESWVTGQLALALLAVDPGGLRGVHLRARAGPVRDACLAGLPEALRPLRRITPSIGDLQLYGGVDIAATLAAGAVRRSAGLLDAPAVLLLSMAERCEPELAARLGQALDGGDHVAILLDEGAEPDERAPGALAERVAFSLDLCGLRALDLAEIALDARDIAQARARLDDVGVPDDAIAALTVTAARFGIGSMRAPLLALAAARANAALSGRGAVGQDDLALAVQLVYAHRATMLPDDAPEDAPQDDAPQLENAPDDAGEDSAAIPPEILVEAMKAMLPPEVLRALAQPGRAKGTGSGGAGKRRKGNRRGRPLPSRPGAPAQGRIDLIATLRAAAPWQPLRRRARPDAPGLIIHPSDIHIRRYQDHSDRLIVFAVDASGSAAMARLAEAKGAVELMLAEAYARRDHVALIAFRGEGAEVVLQPTRSLVQTKRKLAALPGGGGTPLAAGLRAAMDLAARAAGQGLSPSLALLTDGRANVPLPGRTGRAAAAEDAQAMAAAIRARGIAAAVVDTGNRPTRDLATLAVTMGAAYVPLPRADAHSLSRAVGDALKR